MSSKWLGPALGAGFAAGLTGAGWGAAAPAGAAFGQFLGDRFKAITGYGDYTVAKNSLLAGGVPGITNPTMRRGLTISHKEYIGDVITHATPGAFNIQGFKINPGISQTFEWLAQIGVNYEQYSPEGVIFMFKSTSGAALASTNTALGSVIMATQYNPYAPPFSSTAEMMSYMFASVGCPSNDILHPVECAPQDNPLSEFYVRNGPPQGDLRFNDLGTFYIATNGFQAGSVNIGQLWVTYQITLMKPKLFSSLGGFNDYICFYNKGSALTASYPFGLTGLKMDTANVIPIDYIPDIVPPTYQDPVGGQIGVLNGTGFYLQQGTSGTLLIFPPVYAFPACYKVTIFHRTNTDTVDYIPRPTITPTSNKIKIVRRLDAPDIDIDNKFWHFSFFMLVAGGPLANHINVSRERVNISQLKFDPNPGVLTQTYFEMIQVPLTTMPYDYLTT